MERDSGNLLGWAFTSLLVLTATVWGAADGWLKALFLLSALDMLAGGFAALMTQTFTLANLRKGAARKTMLAILVTASLILQTYVAKEIGFSVPVTTAVAAFYVSVEFLSILRNASSLGMPIPRVLLEMGKRIEEVTGGESQASRGEHAV